MEALEYIKEDNNKNDNLIIDEDENDLINRYEVNDNKIPTNEDLMKNNKRKRFPLLFYVFILSVLLLIGCIIFLIVEKIKKKQNYISENDEIEKSGLTEYKYLNLTFENGLQVLLIQIQQNETAGGSIVFDVGKMDNRYQYGELDLALSSLINGVDKVNDLKDYLGEFKQSVENYYSYYSFNILNAGFFDYLSCFSTLTHVDDKDYNEVIDSKKKTIKKSELEGSGINNLDLRENIILENITYGCKNAFEQNPNYEFDNKKIIDIMKNITKPNKMKIVLASHFKLSLMKKKFLKHFNHIVNVESNNDGDDIPFEYKEDNFSSKKFVFFGLKYYESNYLKISYFVNKTNENYYEFIDKLGYFNYLKYILEQTSEGSLYHHLTNSTSYTITTISCDFEVVLKSKIKFSIKINLAPNGYDSLEPIILGTYEYIHNLIKKLSEMVSEDENCDENSRLNELIKINKQDFIFQEDPNDIMDFTKNLSIKLFEKKNSTYFFKENWINSLNKEDVNKYFSQIIPNNSVLFVALNKYAKNKTNLSKNEYFYIEDSLDDLYNNSDNEESLNYLCYDLDTSFENGFNNTINISFHKNNYISKYSNPIPKDKSNDKSENLKQTINNTLRTFDYMKDTSFGLPKVFISLNILHPFFRPNNALFNESDIHSKNRYYCTYFIYILYLTYIKSEILIKLADAKRAHNQFYYRFNQNYIYIEILAYEDVAEIITSQVQEIMNNTTSFSDINRDYKKYNFYVQLALEDYLNTKTIPLIMKRKYLFYYSLNQKMFKNYEFPNEYKNLDYLCKECNDTFNEQKAYITPFIIDGQIYGYYDFEKAKKLIESFNINEEENNFNGIITFAGYNITEVNVDNFKNWITQINSINNDEITSKDTDFDNHYFRYTYWDEYNIVNRVKSEIFMEIIGENYKIADNFTLDINFMHYYGYSYLLFNFYYNKDNEEIDRDDFIKKFKELKEYITDRYNKQKDNYTKDKVDTVGNRFYYLATNTIEKQKYRARDMRSRALANRDEKPFIKDDYSLLESESKKIKEMDYNELIEHFKKIYNESSIHIDIFKDKQ